MLCHKSSFKDQCDICNKFDYLVSIDNKCLCTECCKKQNIKNNKKISKKEQKQLNLFEFS